MDLQASSWICMQAHGSAICMHSGTFWNILEHSECILEHSACILNILEYSGTSACILEHSGTFCLHSGTFCMHSQCCKKVEFQFGTPTHGHTDRHQDLSLQLKKLKRGKSEEPCPVGACYDKQQTTDSLEATGQARHMGVEPHNSLKGGPEALIWQIDHQASQLSYYVSPNESS